MQTQEDFNNNIIRFIFVCGVAYASWKYWQWQRRAGRKNGTAESWRALLQFAGNATASQFNEDAVSRERVPTKAAKRKKGAQRPAQPVQHGVSKADSVAADGTAASGPAQSKASAPQRQSGGPSALQLLEAASSGSSSPRSSRGLEDFKKQGGLDVLDLGLEGADAKRTNDELSAGRVCLLHDVRLGRMSEGVSSSLAALSEELFGRSVWDIISKKNKLRVAACLRWNSDSYEALGLAVYRLQQHALQVVFLGVASAHRGHGIGRSLVRALREAAKREQLCLSIVTLLPAPAAESGLQESAASDDSTPFWRAVGFRRCELKGLADGQVCLNIEVRKLGKRQKSSSLAANQSAHRELLVWSEVLAAAPKAAPPPAEPTSFLRLPPPPPRAGAAAASEELRQATETVPESNGRSTAPRPEKEAEEEEEEEEEDNDGDDDDEEEEEGDDADVEKDDAEDEEGAEEAVEMDGSEDKCKEDANAVIVEDDYGEALGARGEDDDAGEGNGEEWAGAVAVDDNDEWGAEGEAQASLPTAAGSGLAEAGEQEWAGALSAEAAGMSPKVLWGDEEEDDETLRLGEGDARGAFSQPGWSDPGVRSGPDQNREEQKQAGRWRAGAGKGKGKSAQATSPDDAESWRPALKGSQSAQVPDASHKPSRPAARLPAVGRGADGAVLDPEVVAGVEAPLESPPGLRSSDDKELQASSLRLRGWCPEGGEEDEDCEANVEGEGEGAEEDDDDEEEEDEEELRAEVERLRASLAAMDASTTEEEPEAEFLTRPPMAAPRLQLRTATSGWMPTLRHTRGVAEPGKGKAKGR